MAVNKNVKGIFESGSPIGQVTRSTCGIFSLNGLEDEINPFLMLDYAGPTIFRRTDQPSQGWRASASRFETVTIVYQGSLAIPADMPGPSVRETCNG